MTLRNCISSRSGKHKFVILNLLKDKKTEIGAMQLIWMVWAYRPPKISTKLAAEKKGTMV